MLDNEKGPRSSMQIGAENAGKTAPQSLIGDEKLRQLYAAMLKLRMLHSKERGVQAKNRFQEACQVGCTMDLRADDTVAISTNGPFPTLVRGLPLNPWPDSSSQAGVTASNLLQHNHSAERLLMAIGIAFAYRARKQHNVVVAFSDVHGMARARDCIGLSLEHRLPVIFVQQNYNAKTSASQISSRNSQLLTIPVDQRDVIAVYRVAYEAIDKARRGVGPTVIQCVRATKSIRQGSDDTTDPLEYLKRHLLKKSLWSEDFKQSLEESLSRELGRSRRNGIKTRTQ